jgi:hypothetical protein
MSLARRAEVSVKWHSKDKGAVVASDGTFTDITRDLEPHLLGIAYTDNLTGAADDLTIELEDVAELWEGDWRPQLGDQVEATITAEPWLTQVDTLRFGRFAHDKITLALPPHRVTIQAISAPLATGLRAPRRFQWPHLIRGKTQTTCPPPFPAQRASQRQRPLRPQPPLRLCLTKRTPLEHSKRFSGRRNSNTAPLSYKADWNLPSGSRCSR